MEKLIVCDKVVRVRCPQTGNEWVKTSIWEHPIVVAENYANYTSEITFGEFEDFFRYCEEVGVRNCEPYINWLKQPRVWVNDVSQLCHHSIGKRNFRTFSVKVEYEPRPDWSIDFLRKELSAKDFLRLCKSLKKNS